MKVPSSVRPLHVLLVEDSPTDVLLVREALEQAKLAVHLDVAEDGVQAMRYLREHLETDGLVPDLVLLDLNLPAMDGREVLAEIKSDPQLKVIPVVVLTSSTAEDDVLRAYGLHANCYITKPVDFTSFRDVVQSMEQFWFTVVRLPSAG
jgi:CheY-like chemotaxis protein